MAIKKSWASKLYCNRKPIIKRIDFDFADIPANSNMLIATPLLIENYVRQIPLGKTVTPKTMRKDLAIENKADYTCPVTTGIFLRIVAEAGYEKYQQTNSMESISPFWRAIEPNSLLAKKLSFGQDFLIQQRMKELIKD